MAETPSGCEPSLWSLVLAQFRRHLLFQIHGQLVLQHFSPQSSSCSSCCIRQLLEKWDWSSHLPLWVTKNERASIEARLDDWTSQLAESGADIASLASCLRKPLRPLWVSQKTVIWLNEVPDHDSWDFTPLILVSASASEEIQSRTNSEFRLNYIPGAGDDEESWARGLSPNVFWKHVDDLIYSGPDLCNQKVAEIFENDKSVSST